MRSGTPDGLTGEDFGGSRIGVRPVPSKACLIGRPADIVNAVDPQIGSLLNIL